MIVWAERGFGALLAVLILFGSTGRAYGHELEIDTAAARATLDALADPTLTMAAAKRVAALPANRQLIRKVESFGTPLPEGAFESELVAAAQGRKVENERFGFSRTKSKLPQIRSTLAEFDRDRAKTTPRILDRVSKFSPPGPPLNLKGWIIAGGNSTGFAWGGPEFFLKIDDFVQAKDYLEAIMAHELYHAVQNAARSKTGTDEQEEPAPGSATEKAAASVRTILSQLMNEGTASYVGDPALTKSEAILAVQERNRIRAMERLPNRLPTLLDMAILALKSDPPVPVDDVYAVGFYADQPLYYVGYAMAKAISDKRGPSRLGELAVADGCAFANEYLPLSRADSRLLQLGPRTIAAIEESCPGP